MVNETTVIALSVMLLFLVVFVIFQTVAFTDFKRKIFLKLDETNNRVSSLNNLLVSDFKSILEELKNITK
jgi:uncharacterized membrane protein